MILRSEYAQINTALLRAGRGPSHGPLGLLRHWFIQRVRPLRDEDL